MLLSRFRPRCSWRKARNLIAFWFFGLGNNFSYVIMLSAAVDIIKSQEDKTPNVTSVGVSATSVNCTKIGTGGILLADILPSVFIKFVAPLFLHHIHFHLKVFMTSALAFSSFILVALSPSMTVSFLGVMLASFSSGIGDVTFLSMSAFFDNNVISAWSSGTGAAGLIGSLAYVLLTLLTTPVITLYVVMCVPVLLSVIYIFVLERPNHPNFRIRCCPCLSGSRVSLPDNATLYHTHSDSTVVSIDAPEETLYHTDEEAILRARSGSQSRIEEIPDDEQKGGDDTECLSQEHPTLRMKLQIFKGMAGLLISLILVYFFEYLINQTLFELMLFPDFFLSEPAEYRWYQALYQTGVFISRSSVNLFQLRRTWITAILQFINFVFLLTQVIYQFIPSIWIVSVIILYEGLLGGLSYVNTFYRILKETNPKFREYAMTSAAVSDAIGISVAGFLSLPLHNWLCDILRRN